MLERQPCHLEHLSCEHVKANALVFFDWLLGTQTTVDMANLRVFELSACSEFVYSSEILRLIRGLRSSLEHLTLSPTGVCYHFIFFPCLIL
jgi:hypothetical protein